MSNRDVGGWRAPRSIDSTIAPKSVRKQSARKSELSRQLEKMDTFMADTEDAHYTLSRASVGAVPIPFSTEHHHGHSVGHDWTFPQASSFDEPESFPAQSTYADSNFSTSPPPFGTYLSSRTSFNSVAGQRPPSVASPSTSLTNDTILPPQVSLSCPFAECATPAKTYLKKELNDHLKAIHVPALRSPNSPNVFICTWCHNSAATAKDSARHILEKHCSLPLLTCSYAGCNKTFKNGGRDDIKRNHDRIHELEDLRAENKKLKEELDVSRGQLNNARGSNRDVTHSLQRTVADFNTKLQMALAQRRKDAEKIKALEEMVRQMTLDRETEAEQQNLQAYLESNEQTMNMWAVNASFDSLNSDWNTQMGGEDVLYMHTVQDRNGMGY